MVSGVEVFLEERKLEQLAGGRPPARIFVETVVYKIDEFVGIPLGNRRDRLLLYVSIKLLKVLSLVRRFQCRHFVDNAAQRPDIASAIVGLISPHFRTGVVRSSSLRVGQLPSYNLGHVKIAQLKPFRCLEDVG